MPRFNPNSARNFDLIYSEMLMHQATDSLGVASGHSWQEKLIVVVCSHPQLYNPVLRISIRTSVWAWYTVGQRVDMSKLEQKNTKSLPALTTNQQHTVQYICTF